MTLVLWEEDRRWFERLDLFLFLITVTQYHSHTPFAAGYLASALFRKSWRCKILGEVKKSRKWRKRRNSQNNHIDVSNEFISMFTYNSHSQSSIFSLEFSSCVFLPFPLQRTCWCWRSPPPRPPRPPRNQSRFSTCPPGRLSPQILHLPGSGNADPGRNIIAHLSLPLSNGWVALSFLFVCLFVRPSRYGNIPENLHFFQYIQA